MLYYNGVEMTEGEARFRMSGEGVGPEIQSMVVRFARKSGAAAPIPHVGSRGKRKGKSGMRYPNGRIVWEGEAEYDRLRNSYEDQSAADGRSVEVTTGSPRHPAAIPPSGSLRAAPGLIDPPLRTKGTDRTPGKVIRSLVREYKSKFGYESAEKINAGSCDSFAVDVVKRLPGAVALWDHEMPDSGHYYENHAFVAYRGRFYDADHPDGVDDWKSMKEFGRARPAELPDQKELMAALAELDKGFEAKEQAGRPKPITKAPPPPKQERPWWRRAIDAVVDDLD